MLHDEHVRNVLEPRAIKPDVYGFSDGRERYSSVVTYDELKAAHSHPKSAHAKALRKSGALVINRWNLDGDPLPSYLRFDSKINYDSRTRNFTSYIYPSREDAGSQVKVIDVHPLARPSILGNPGQVYFCLEGCFKADALLSLGGITKAVMSVPAVTLWELSPREFAPYRRTLRTARDVMVIPDSDYMIRGYAPDGRPDLFNENVHYQTDKCAWWLREQGINASLLVPPFLSADQALSYGIPKKDRTKIGVDDLLRIGGNLGPWNRSTNPLGVHRFSYIAYRASLPLLERKRQDRAVDRDSQVLAYLTGFGGKAGVFRPGDLMAALDLSLSTAYRAIESLKERGVLRVWRGKSNVSDAGRVYNESHLYSLSAEAAFRYDSFKEIMPRTQGKRR